MVVRITQGKKTKLKSKKELESLSAAEQTAILGKHLKSLKKQIREGGADKSAADNHRLTLQMLTQMMTRLEQNFYDRPDSRNVYAILKIIEQIRGLYQELRTTASSEAQIEYINTKIVVAAWRLYLQQFLNETFLLKRELGELGGTDKKSERIRTKIDAFVKNQGSFMTNMEKSMQEQVIKFLS